MDYRVIHIIILLQLVLAGCKPGADFEHSLKINDAYFTGKVVLSNQSKINRNRIELLDANNFQVDKIFTPYDIYDMQLGDINRDGKQDICLGIIKPTPFDSVLKKRLFLFQIDRGYIRPLWLGSRLSKPLEAFAIVPSRSRFTYVYTIERCSQSTYSIQMYVWRKFGLDYLLQTNSNLNLTQAQQLLSIYKNTATL